MKETVKSFFKDVISCLTEPGRFFSDCYPQYTLTKALAFGLIVSWIASFLEWLTQMVSHESYLDGFTKIRAQLETFPAWKAIAPRLFSDATALNMVPVWIAGFGKVALNPFATLIGIAISASMIWMGALILIPRTEDRDPLEYNSFLKLVAVASCAPKLVAAILGFLPLAMGALVGVVYAFIVQIYALKTRYKISGLRSMAVMILPSFILFFAGACFIGLIGGMLFALIGSMFH